MHNNKTKPHNDEKSHPILYDRNAHRTHNDRTKMSQTTVKVNVKIDRTLTLDFHLVMSLKKILALLAAIATAMAGLLAAIARLH